MQAVLFFWWWGLLNYPYYTLKSREGYRIGHLSEKAGEYNQPKNFDYNNQNEDTSLNLSVFSDFSL